MHAPWPTTPTSKTTRADLTALTALLPLHMDTTRDFEPHYTLGLVEEADVPSLAALLARGFPPHPSQHQIHGHFAQQHGAEPRAVRMERGLRWRLGPRLADPTLELPHTSSLALGLLHRGDVDGARPRLVAAAELSLRPKDGTLPAEFAVPPVFTLHAQQALSPYIYNVVVDASFRGQRIGSRLLRSCEHLVRREWGYGEVHLHVDLGNAHAVALYEGSGYEALPEFDAAAAISAPVVVEAGEGAVRRVLNRYYRKQLSERAPAREAAGALSSGASQSQD